MKPESCIGCPYYSRHMIRGQGHPSAKLIIIGQSPGAQEDLEGIPFTGPSGQILNQALRKADIIRSENYVTNIVKCFVPAGEKVEPQAIKQCKPLLQKEFEMLPQAKTVLTLGAEAFNALTGKEVKFVHNRKAAEKSSTTWLRGSPYPLGDAKVVIPTLHPSFVMRSGFLNAPTFEHDVRKAGEFVEGGRKQPSESFSYSPTNQEVREYISLILQARECGLDIETTESNTDEDDLDSVTQTTINLIGLSVNIGETVGVHPDQFHLLDPLFEMEQQRERVRTWVYNAGFDYLHLGVRWKLTGVQPADAMIAFFLLWSDLMSFDFATAASYYCNFGYYKNWRLLDRDKYATLGNCRDTYGGLQIGQECLKEMCRKKINMEPLFWSLMPVIKAVEPWRTHGCNYNTTESMRVYLHLTKMLEGYETWWQQNIPSHDWSSPKQLAELLTLMGVKVPKKKRPNGTFTPCVDDDALETMENNNVPIAKLIREMRTLRKASDFVDLADKDGRVRTRAKLHGQAGGRIQLVDKSLQTIPETLGGTYPRSLIIPDHPDDLILVSDFSQAEFWIYAWYTQDPELLRLKETGDYVYGFFHEEIWKEPFFEQGKPRQKKYALKSIEPWKLLVTKSYPLGFTYGRRAVESKYKWLLDWYHKKFTRVDPFHRELTFTASRDHYLQTVFGRMRRFPNPKGQHNSILAFPGQSTLPDVLVRNGILPLSDGLPRTFGERSRVLFSVHDSVICNIQNAARSIKIATDALDYVTGVLQSPIPEMNGFWIGAESKIGPNWSTNFALHKLPEWWEKEHSGEQLPTEVTTPHLTV